MSNNIVSYVDYLADFLCIMTLSFDTKKCVLIKHPVKYGIMMMSRILKKVYGGAFAIKPKRLNF